MIESNHIFTYKGRQYMRKEIVDFLKSMKLDPIAPLDVGNAVLNEASLTRSHERVYERRSYNIFKMILGFFRSEFKKERGMIKIITKYAVEL